ncbi:MAG: D-alanyl-D-alanine carboxypeptidase [Lachnospiraceae bacterium]|nr:D-alanyl-D-alanine carboxypeptidase [Lachnospiraceae bacterium]
MKTRYFFILLAITLIMIKVVNGQVEKNFINNKTAEREKLSKILFNNESIISNRVKEKNNDNTSDNVKEIKDNNSSGLSKLRLYSKAACVYDAKSNRVLCGDNENMQLPMASTTKIMTCIIALEYGDLEQEIVFSKYAASMPNVQLNAIKGEKFKLKDLLHSLMLESHNDTAVAIAENIAASVELKEYNAISGGSKGVKQEGKFIGNNIEENSIEMSKKLVEKFAQLMNKKAVELGATSTNFVTPNGLDADKHYTTAADLCKIAGYAIKNQEFINITNRKYYSLVSVEGKEYSLNNANSFLSMYNGAIGCKTGYTSKAGYCFVGAIDKGEHRLVSAVLASGWPPNKSYKWSDTIKIMDFACGEYQNKELEIDNETLNIERINVENGVKEYGKVHIQEQFNLLLGPEDKIRYKVVMPKGLHAPLYKNEKVAVCRVYINDDKYKEFSVVMKETVKLKSYERSFNRLFKIFTQFKYLKV